ncbi:MAG: hypothetical protein HWN65_08950 [Candidatus Helarchaeota archaeon]|nr:hypothetical protein [Candidatus Helarchaeota archaeon]
MSKDKKPEFEILSKDRIDHKVTDLYYSLNFELTKVSDSKASTLIIISGQSILITAFLLANLIGEPNVIPIVVGFAVSVVFNVCTIFFSISALRPRTFQATSTALQPLYSHITKHTREQFIKEFLKFHYLSKEENDKHFAEVIYEVASILEKKMRRVHMATRLFFIGVGILAASIFILVVQLFVLNPI